MRALVYCRVSSERQKNEGHGLDSQEHRCREYARQKGYEVEKVFRDSFTGGGDFMKRPAMKELIDYLSEKAHKNFVVIFDDLKRFSRDVVYHWKLREVLKRLGAEVQSPNFEFKEDNEEGWLHESITAVFNDYDRRTNRRQVVQKMKARLEKGYWPFNPPAGLKHTKHAVHGMLLTRHEPKASIIAEAMEGFASDRFLDQVDVQKFLQQKNLLNGKHVSLEYVSRLLKRIIYAGYIEYLEWEITRRKGHHEALISLETYEDIQLKLQGKRRVRDRKDINKDFPLRGFALCPDCLKPMTAAWTTNSKGSKFPYYRCKTRGCVKFARGIPRKKIEPDFENILKSIKPSNQILNLAEALFRERWNKKLIEISNSCVSKEAQLKDIQAQLESLARRVGKATDETIIRVYEDQIKELGNKELLLKENVEGIKAMEGSSRSFESALGEVMSVLKDPYSYWANGDLGKKRLILKMAFEEKIAYDKENGFCTAKLSLPLRVFELVGDKNSRGVEAGRFALPSK